MDRSEIDGFGGVGMGEPRLVFRGRGEIGGYVERLVFGLSAMVHLKEVSFGPGLEGRFLTMVVPVDDASIPVGTVVDVSRELLQGPSMVVSSLTMAVVPELEKCG